MTTNIDIITQAFRKANIIAQIANPSAAQSEQGLADLNRMMYMLEQSDIYLQWYTQTDTAATFPCPEYTEQGVIGSLAVAISPNYGREVSVELAKYASDGMAVISRKSINKKIRPVDVSHLPPGSGLRGLGRIFEG